MNPGVVPMIAPNGSSGDVPFDRVKDATAAGFKTAVVMTSPDGQMGYVPQERAADAMKAGFKVGQPTTQFEKDRAPAVEESQTVRNPWAEAGNFIKNAVPAALDEAGNIVKNAPGMVKALADPIHTGLHQAADIAVQDQVRKNRGASAVERVGAATGSALGANMPAVEHAADIGNAPGVVGTLATDVGVPVAAGELIKGVAKLPGKVAAKFEGSLAPRMAEVPAGEQFSRQQVLDAARANGVNLDLAQATDASIPKSIKRANQYSLTGEGSYESNAKTNMNALEDWANKEASRYAPESGGREVVGGQLQKALQQNVQTRQAAATQLFNDLDKNVGSVKPDATSIYDKAKQIVAENADYYDKNPALKQSRAWQIVNDLANRSEATRPTTSTVTSKLVDEGGNPYTKQVTNAPKVSPDTWTDLQKLRTDLMNEYRSPDIAGSRAEGWLKQLTGTVDQSMTGAASGMTGADLAKFRQANGIWESIKNSYDNPQSPYYHALRAQYPSQIPGMLSKGTPELARQVRDTLGALEGPFQRQFVENLLYAKDGQTLELGRLNQKLKGVSQEHLEAMIGSEGAKQLQLLAKVAQKVTADGNPSGTAKGVVKTTEVVNALHNPVAGAAELGGNFAAGKMMNSPKFVDYLTKPKK